MRQFHLWDCTIIVAALLMVSAAIATTATMTTFIHIWESWMCDVDLNAIAFGGCNISACVENDIATLATISFGHCSIWAHRDGMVDCASLHWELNAKREKKAAKTLKLFAVRSCTACCMHPLNGKVCKMCMRGATVLCHVPHMTAFGYAFGRCIAASEIGKRK